MIPQTEIIPAELIASEAFREALGIAAHHARDVDREARFPTHAMEALRAAGALGWGVPREFGGAGARIEDLAGATLQLSRRCASSGMIFAMHQIQVACITRHMAGSRWFADYLRRVVHEQRLIASATSESGVGGDVRRSNAALCPVSDNGDGLVGFEKKASTISYGAQTDDLLTTLRRAPDAEHSDQVLVLTMNRQMQLTPTGEWDTLGMRGTCSPGFAVKARCHADQVLPVPFASIAAETMVPYSHILWSHVWLGIALDAFERAQNFVREQARRTPGVTPPAALRLSELSARMAQFRALVEASLEEFRSAERPKLSTVGYALRINNLKIAASEAAVEICEGALRVCGLAGYGNAGPFSVGRNLRDAHSAVLMIANDRLHATNAALLTVHREGK
ncbi:MAG TPA: acyl-CoA dehydrogenase family protein [Bryobacteraceae bacterium]|nr:acyl-CoA dehydrogenase family protein [Bryobacteraceae bacterium]